MNLEAAHVTKEMGNDTVKTKADYINQTVEPLEAHQRADHAIMTNEGLSQQGKMEALKKLGTTQTAPALKWLKGEIDKLNARQQNLRTQLFSIASPIDNAVERTLMYQYIWSKVDPLDQAARVTQFAQASERDDLKVMVAMLENPFGPMINEEVKARVLTDRAKRLTPTEYHNYEQNQILLEFLLMARDWIARWLAEEVGVENAVIRTNFGDDIADALSGTP